MSIESVVIAAAHSDTQSMIDVLIGVVVALFVFIFKRESKQIKLDIKELKTDQDTKRKQLREDLHTDLNRIEDKSNSDFTRLMHRLDKVTEQYEKIQDLMHLTREQTASKQDIKDVLTRLDKLQTETARHVDISQCANYCMPKNK